MNSQRFIFWVSLAVSVVLHVVLIVGIGFYAGSAVLTKPLVLVPDDQTDRPEVEKRRPPEPEFIIGRAGGIGEANDDSPGELPQTSTKEFEDQAFLTRDPAGEGGASAPSAKPPVQPKELTTPAEQPIKPVGAPSNPLAMALRQASEEESPAREPEVAKPTPPQEAKPVEQTQAQTQAQSTSDRPAGLPATPSDRDSDLFSKNVSVELRDGKVTARSGREVKFVRPQINLAAIVDGAAISFPALVKMLVDVDETGSVRHVTITRSTGSSSIDRAIELAAYKSWFEPAKRNGKPVRDEVEFAVVLN